MSQQETYFQKAVEFIGETWIEEKHSEFYGEESSNHLTEEEAPKIVKQYHTAKRELENQNEDIPELDSEGSNENTVKFLMLGQIYDKVEKCPIISPESGVIQEKTVKDFYQNDLRNDQDFLSSRFELQTAARYIQRGHDIGFVDEEVSSEKTPDLEILDLEEKVQIECKRCRKTSKEEKANSNLLNDLLAKTRRQLSYEQFIGLYELDRIPESEEVNELNLPDKCDLNRLRSDKQLELPFGQLNLIKFPGTGITKQPLFGLEGFEIQTNFYETFIRPALSRKLDVDKDAHNLGFWAPSMKRTSRDEENALYYRDVKWLGIKENNWSTDPKNRFKNQFEGVSGKFDGCTSILEIFFPGLDPNDGLQDLRLRRMAGGELKERKEITVAIVSSLELSTNSEKTEIKRPETLIPNYNPKYSLPESLNIIEGNLEDAVHYDNLVTDASEDLLSDKDGFRRAIDQKEGTITFRFTPEETINVDSEKIIASSEGLDSNNSLDLKILPEKKFELILSKEDEKDIRRVDCSDLKNGEPIKFCIAWSKDHTQLIIKAKSLDEPISSKK